jgi:hypothetical protein
MLMHEEQEQLIKKIIDAFDTDIQEALALTEKTFTDLLITSGFTSVTALESQILFQEALTQARYYEKVNDLIDNKFDEIYRLIRQGFVEAGFTTRYTSDDLSKIVALKQLQLQQFDTLANETATSVQQKLYKYVLSDFSAYEMQQQLKVDLADSKLYRYSTTLANTSIAEFQQAVIDIKAQDLDGVWIYVGVSDSKTRDFCQDILSDRNYYTDEQKKKIQNDPKRKYNCRHRLRYVSLEYAQDRGYNGI